MALEHYLQRASKPTSPSAMVMRVQEVDKAGNLTNRPPRFARINADADGDNTIIPAQGAGNKIRVLSYALTVSAAGTVTIRSGATVLSEFTLPANGGVSYDGPSPAFETAANQALIINNTAGMDTNGHLAYVVQ